MRQRPVKSGLSVVCARESMATRRPFIMIITITTSTMARTPSTVRKIISVLFAPGLGGAEIFTFAIPGTAGGLGAVAPTLAPC